jgi:LuxR family maltose regulon positive regulatory protein
LALDPGDADLRLFLTHLVAAIRTAEPEAGVEALDLLEAGGATPTDAVLVSLINVSTSSPVPWWWRSTTTT